MRKNQAPLSSKPKISYAQPDDPWLTRHLILCIENLLGRRRVQKVYDNLKLEPFELRSFFQRAIAETGISINYDHNQLSKLPKKGPLVIVANHPFGLIDGMILCHLATQARGNFRILINSVLCRDRDLAPYFLPVDFSAGKKAAKSNLLMSQSAIQAMNQGIPVLIFPSGFVSTANNFGFGEVTDAPWTNFAAKIIKKSGAAVVPIYFHGKNSRSFHIASKIAEPLRMALLIREARSKFGESVRVNIGDTIAASELSDFQKRSALTQFLYHSVQQLAHVA